MNNRSVFEVMFGEPPSHPLDAVLGVDFGIEVGIEEINPRVAVAKHCEELAEAKESRHLANVAGAAKRPPPDFELGDFLLVLARGHRHKLQMRWLGPHRVVDTVSDFVYVVKYILTQERTSVYISIYTTSHWAT